MATVPGRADRQVRRVRTVAVRYILKPREPIYRTSTVSFYTPQMPKKKATSKRVHIRSPRRLTGMLCALTNGRVSPSKLLHFGAPPPQAAQTLPRLSLCLHACADTVCASDDFPLPLLSLSSPGTSTGARRSASEAAATVAAATTTTAAAEVRMCRWGVLRMRARGRRRGRRPAATVSTSRLVVVVLFSGQWSVECARAFATRA